MLKQIYTEKSKVKPLGSYALDTIRKSFDEYEVDDDSNEFMILLYNSWIKKYPIAKNIKKYEPFVKDFIINNKDEVKLECSNNKLRYELHKWLNNLGVSHETDKTNKKKKICVRRYDNWRWEYTKIPIEKLEENRKRDELYKKRKELKKKQEIESRKKHMEKVYCYICKKNGNECDYLLCSVYFPILLCEECVTLPCEGCENNHEEHPFDCHKWEEY